MCNYVMLSISIYIYINSTKNNNKPKKKKKKQQLINCINNKLEFIIFNEMK